MMDPILSVMLGILLYLILCLVIAAIRALFSKSPKRKQTFSETFWCFFLEVINPFNWF